MSPGSTVSLRVKCSPKSVEAVLALIFYNPSFLYIPLHCTNFFKPPNVLEWLVDVLIKRLESAFQCRLQAESYLFAFYPRSLLKTGRASSQPVCSFNSSSVVSRCECKSRLHSNTVGLRSQLCLNLCFLFFFVFLLRSDQMLWRRVTHGSDYSRRVLLKPVKIDVSCADILLFINLFLGV